MWIHADFACISPLSPLHSRTAVHLTAHTLSCPLLWFAMHRPVLVTEVGEFGADTLVMPLGARAEGRSDADIGFLQVRFPGICPHHLLYNLLQLPYGRHPIGSRPASWKCILSPGFQDRSRRDPKYVPRARHFCVIEVIILPFQICDRIFQKVTSDSIKCNGSFVRSLYGRICRGGQGGDREIARDRGWLRGVVWSGRVGLLHVCTNHN